MGDMGNTILVVHPDTAERERLAGVLAGAGFRCIGTASPEDAILTMASGPVLVIVAASLRDSHGNLLAARLKAAHEGNMCVVMVDATSRQDFMEALEADICDVLPRGASDEELLSAISDVLAMKQRAECSLEEEASGAGVPVVAVVCDNAILKRGLSDVLNKDPELALVGYYPGVDDFLSRYDGPEPDLILMCGSCNFVCFEEGVANLDRVFASYPDARVVLFNQKMPAERQAYLLKLGIGGFLETEWPEEKFRELLHRVVRGHIVAREEVMVKALRELSRSRGRGVNGGSAPVTPSVYLTEREKEVVRLIARGLKNRDIGQALYISEKTVKTHVNNIMKKLNAGNRIQAVRRAVELDLL